jgi:hypothetical protein
MNPIEFNAYLETLNIIRAKQDPDTRYKIAVIRETSPVHNKVYRNWLNRELGLEDLYQDLLAQESASLQIAYPKPVPDQPLNPPGC